MSSCFKKLPLKFEFLSLFFRENQGEQFTQFTKLVQFLLKQNGLELEVDEFDDPSQIVSQVGSFLGTFSVHF